MGDATDGDWELLPELRAALDAEAVRDDDAFVETLRVARDEFVETPLRDAVDTTDESDEDDESESLPPVEFFSDDSEYPAVFAAAEAVVDHLIETLRPDGDGEEDEASDPQEEPVDFDSIAGPLRASLRRVLGEVVATVPRETFDEFVRQLASLSSIDAPEEREPRLTYVVSLAVALAELARADATVVAHLSERLPAGVWLFYTKWMLVVYKITGAFAWFGDQQTQSFWLALDAAAASTVAQTQLLNVLETLVAKEFGEHKEQEEEEAGDEDDDRYDSVLTLSLFSLEELAGMLNFMNASPMPAYLDDLPRLSRQASRRAMVQSICRDNRMLCEVASPAHHRLSTDQETDQSRVVRRLQIKFAVCLYYIEQLEITNELEPSWGMRVVVEWAKEFDRRLGDEEDPAKIDTALNALLVTLRQLWQLPYRDPSEVRDALVSIDPIRGPVESVRVERAVKNLTLAEVLDYIGENNAGCVNAETLARVRHIGTSLVAGRADRSGSTEDSYLQELMHLDRAVHKVRGFWLYPVQLVAVICGTMAANDQAAQSSVFATVLQMETGEGKSITFAVIAAFFARKGKRVDIATSNSQLALDGAADATPLFAELGVSCAVVTGEEDSSTPRPIGSSVPGYDRQVVYSTISSLAGDYLREIIFQDRGRGHRPFDVLLADEVDAMLVDNAANVTMLSTPVAGMDKLLFLYGAVYDRVRRVIEADASSAGPPDPADEELRSMLGLPVASSETSVSSSGESQSQVLPKEFLSLCDKKLALYMDQSWMAQAQMKLGREYDVIDGKVVVIDNRTSGEYQSNSVYGDGLHQFLQLKHGTEFTTESLNSIFISNGAFARKYTQFVGLTGTLGDSLDRAAMINALVSSGQLRRSPTAASRVQFVFLPRSKARPFTEFPPLVFDDAALAFAYCVREIEWCRAVGRPILLVCQDKASAVNLANEISQREIHAKLYIINDKSLQTFSATHDRLGAGDVVVSTTYGGRGTDYKLTKEAENNGGLHTVLLFQTAGRRQRDQIFGRSARAGVPGSGVLITHYRYLLASPSDLASRLVEYNEFTAAQYRESLADQIKSNVPLNEGCDQLFQRFVSTYSKAVKTIKRSARGALRWHLTEAVRNRFGILMEELKFQVADKLNSEASVTETTETPADRMLIVYDVWEQKIEQDLAKNDHVITNPRAMVVYAKEIARCATSMPKIFHWSDVTRVVARAMESDSFMAGSPAHFLKVQAMIKTKKRNARLESDYKELKATLEEALASVDYEVEFYASVSCLVSQNKHNVLSAQLTRVVDILMTMHSSVEEALATIEGIYKKRDEDDRDKYFLTITFDGLPDGMDEGVVATYRDMCDTGGHVGLLRISEEREWSWDWNAFGCLLLGVAQVIGGSVLMLLSAGTYGLGLIAEGVSDFVASLVAVIKGDGSFSWTEYFQNKLISLAMAVVCAGVCKLGKALWNTGKTMFKNGLMLVKSGWKRMLQSAARGMRVVVNRTKAAVAKVANAISAPTRAALRKGMEQCGNKLGRELAKQVVISAVNVGVDEAIKAAFDAMQQSIRNGVTSSVEKWVQQHEADLAKFCLLRGSTAYKILVEKSRARMFQPESEVKKMLVRFGNELAGTICEQLKDHSQKGGSKRHALIATSIKVLLESTKWAIVVHEVTVFVDAWLAVAREELKSELDHIECVAMNKCDMTQAHKDAMTRLGIDKHDAGSDVHLRCSRAITTEDLAVFEDAKKLGNAIRLAHASYERVKIFEESAAKGEIGSWGLQRGLLTASLADVATSFIRDKLESRSAETSRKIASYGMSKLVDKLAQGYLVRKSKKLADYKPRDEADAADHERRVNKFMQDLEVQEIVKNQILSTEDSMATMAHARALALARGVCIIIHDEKGEQAVINPSASGAQVHLQATGSKGNKAHLRPMDDPHGNYVDDPNGLDCLYRAVFFATSENQQNASEADVVSLRADVAGHFVASPRLQVLLYANQKPRRVYGGSGQKKKKNESSTANVPSSTSVEGGDSAKLVNIADDRDYRLLFNHIVGRWCDDRVASGPQSKNQVTKVKFSDFVRQHLQQRIKNDNLRRMWQENRRENTFVRIDKQTELEEGGRRYHQFQVQIGNDSLACIKIPEGRTFNLRELRRAFHESQASQRIVTLPSQ